MAGRLALSLPAADPLKLHPALVVRLKRVQASLRRLEPAAVDDRKEIIKKRISRRVYVADYEGQRSHFDLECKLTFGGVVTLYIF